jgi:NitT/TauT family transport system substrate-binding protein
MRIKISPLLLAVLLLTVALAACSPAAAVPAAQKVPIKFTALRILDILPMYVAQQEGLFGKHGLDVQILPAGAPTERDQLIAAGQADGMINEISGTLFFDKDKTQAQIVRFARVAQPDTHLFSILASKKSGITDVNGLKGASIGISNGTIIEYLTNRMLEKEGLTASDYKTVSVPNLSDRLTLLNSGELQAAVLPEPMATLALQQGAKLVLDDSKYPDLSSSTITFRKEFIDSHPEAVKGFLAAVDEAVQLINANPGKYQSLLTDLNVIPAPLQGSFKVPQFAGTNGVPSQQQFQDVLDWTKAKGMMKTDVAYNDAVNASFLSK